MVFWSDLYSISVLCERIHFTTRADNVGSRVSGVKSLTDSGFWTAEMKNGSHHRSGQYVLPVQAANWQSTTEHNKWLSYSTSWLVRRRGNMDSIGRWFSKQWSCCNTWQCCRQPSSSVNNWISECFKDRGCLECALFSLCKWWQWLIDPTTLLPTLSARYSCGAQTGAGGALNISLWHDAGAWHHAKWS